MPVVGVKKANRNLERIQAAIFEAMKDQNQENAEELLSDASDLAPQLSGDLIESGKVTAFNRKAQFIRIVSFDTPYAIRWHEDKFIPGEITRTKPGAGRKYLSRAYNKKRKKFEQRIGKAVNRRIQVEVQVLVK